MDWRSVLAVDKHYCTEAAVEADTGFVPVDTDSDWPVAGIDLAVGAADIADSAEQDTGSDTRSDSDSAVFGSA